jgi:hypothetical protein
MVAVSSVRFTINIFVLFIFPEGSTSGWFMEFVHSIGM